MLADEADDFQDTHLYAGAYDHERARMVFINTIYKKPYPTKNEPSHRGIIEKGGLVSSPSQEHLPASKSISGMHLSTPHPSNAYAHH